MKFTLDQHKRTGLELQLFHDTIQAIAVIITGAYPQRHQLYRPAGMFYGGPGSPLFDLIEELDNLLYKEQPAGDDCRKIYFLCRGMDNYTPLELLPGLPDGMACNFAALQTQRQDAEKHPLTAFELLCLTRSLHHVESKLAFIGIGLAEAYYPNVALDNKVKAALDTITRLIVVLCDELAVIQGTLSEREETL